MFIFYIVSSSFVVSSVDVLNVIICRFVVTNLTTKQTQQWEKYIECHDLSMMNPIRLRLFELCLSPGVVTIVPWMELPLHDFPIYGNRIVRTQRP